MKVNIEAIRSEEEVVALIQQGQGDINFIPRFLALLEERHPVYQGLDSATVIRIRGSLIRSISKRVLPQDALPFVLEELESAFDPWLTSVAAAALRKYPEPSSRFVQPLLEAIIYIRSSNDITCLSNYGGYGKGDDITTPLDEILKTLSWLGSHGYAALPNLHKLASEITDNKSLCSAVDSTINILENARSSEEAREPDLDKLAAITRLYKPLPGDLKSFCLQDQSGRILSLPSFFQGQPTVVVFFFTRCGNPAKCPLTISRLGRLQKHIRRAECSVRTAAITYDPEYDDPRRLTQYARSWGAIIDENHRFFRTVENYELFRKFFELGVSYGGSTVNQHQLEAYVLNADCSIVGAVRRKRLDALAIMSELEKLSN